MYRKCNGSLVLLPTIEDSSPLHQLTRKDTHWSWSNECEIAFQQLKDILTTSPVLAYPDFDREYVLETDASVQGLGAVLSQEQADGKLDPVAYASRVLNPSGGSRFIHKVAFRISSPGPKSYKNCPTHS